MQSVAQRAEPPVAALATLNAFLAESQVHGQIVRSNGDYEVRFRPEDDMALPIWRLTDSAARLLLSPDRENVRECPGHDCGWLFLDARLMPSCISSYPVCSPGRHKRGPRIRGPGHGRTA
jgi:predicted RNA-binding Zn ribbon-like protein